MKKILFIILVVFSCNQRDDKEAPEAGFGGSVSFVANGKPVKFSKNIFEVADRNLVLKSYSGDSLRIELTLCDGIAETSYQIADTLANGILFFPSDGSRNFSPHFDSTTPNGNIRGKVEITVIDEKNQTMSGTFSARLSRRVYSEMKIGDSTEMTIANGTFTAVPYKIEDAPTGSLQIAKIDGLDFKAALMSSGYGSIVEFTFSDNNRQLGFRFSDDIALGKHEISEFNDYNIFPNIWYMDGIHAYKARSGTITITEVTLHKHIKGTFSFDVESYPIAGQTKSITEGSFDVTFPDQ